MADKRIKLETLSQKSKKKKDFLVVGGIVSVLVLVGFSVFNYSLDVNQEKLFKKKNVQMSDNNDVNLSPEAGLKAAWAISVENTLADQDKKFDRLMDYLETTKKKDQAEMNKMITDLTKSQEETIFKLQKDLETEKNRMKSTMDEALLKQQNELERLKAEAKKVALQPGQNVTEEDISLGFDLLPNVKIDKKDQNQSKSEIDQILDETGGEGSGPFGQPKGQTSVKGDGDGDGDGPKLIEKKKVTFRKIDTSSVIDSLLAEKRRELNQIKERAKEKNSYHVMTGLSEAFLITGAYAPAFSEGKSDPLPVLMQAVGDIHIANDDTQSLRDCFFLGSAKGNMNSQTADIRLNKISCSLAGGTKKIEGSISGWVIGENGIPGVQGELLHKNGAWMAKTFVAGFLETFSKSAVGFSTGSGAASSGKVTVGTSLAQSGSQSSSELFSKIGEYYLKMAEQIFPVIEVKPGRTVDIFLQGGTTLAVSEFNSARISEIESEIYELEAEKKADAQRKSEIEESMESSDSANADSLIPEITNSGSEGSDSEPFGEE